MEQPLRIPPDLSYAVLCAFPPSDALGAHSLIGILNEIVAPELPYAKQVYLVVAWQRGMGTFRFQYRITDQDGALVAESQPDLIAMEQDGNEMTYPSKIHFSRPGLYLIEGFLDDDRCFRITLRTSLRA